MNRESVAGTPAQFVITTPAGLETEARRELRRALPEATFWPLFFKGNLLMVVGADEVEAGQRIASAHTACVARVVPVRERVQLGPGLASARAVAEAAAASGRIRPGDTFLVRCRRRGRHDWRSRDLERLVAAVVSELTGGVGEYEQETDWQVAVEVFQDLAYVGVVRPSQLIVKTPHRRRKYAPGRRPLNRAQWKLTEALTTFGITLPPGGRALDLGSAPGGWAMALAGLVQEVVAVDPAELDPAVAALPNVRHVRCHAEELAQNPDRWEQFDLLTSDINRDPEEVSRLLCKLAGLLKPGAPAIMTVKYTTRERGRHERDARRVLEEQYTSIYMQRLPHNARETTAVMWRRRAEGPLLKDEQGSPHGSLTGGCGRSMMTPELRGDDLVDHLWAPWRMRYVTAEAQEGCIFCDKPAAGDDEVGQILHRGESVFIMLNAFPYNSGHLLVAPFRHVSNPLDLTPQESSELLYGVRVAIEALNAALKPEGFNIGANIGKVAGAGYADHLHLHVVPRWTGDTNFMAVAAGTRVVPESLADTYRRLRKAISQFPDDAST